MDFIVLPVERLYTTSIIKDIATIIASTRRSDGELVALCPINITRAARQAIVPIRDIHLGEPLPAASR